MTAQELRIVLDILNREEWIIGSGKELTWDVFVDLLDEINEEIENR